MAKLVTAQPKFKMLVANLEGSGDPSKGLNPVKVRTGFIQQHFPEVPTNTPATRSPDVSTPGVHTYMGLGAYTTPDVPVGASATLVVGDNDFTSSATLYLGEYALESDVDFTVGGDTDATATALGAAIALLPGFTSQVVASTITITGPFGFMGNQIPYRALYSGSVQNYTLTPSTGYLTGAEPRFGPPGILS